MSASGAAGAATSDGGDFMMDSRLKKRCTSARMRCVETLGGIEWRCTSEREQTVANGGAVEQSQADGRRETYV